MRKIIVITLLLTLTRMLAAQVYLTEVLEPIGDEKSLRHVYPFIEDSERSVYNSMTLQDYLLPAGIALYDKNEAISFKLNKQYSKLSFMFGPTGNNRINDAGVMIITGDGETIFDEYVLGFSEPRFMVVDVAGIDQITFSLVEDNQSVNAAMMQLWKEGETVVMPELPFAPPARKTQLVAEHLPYCTKFHHMIREDLREVPYLKHKIIIWSDYEDSISIGRYIYKSGIQMRSSQGLFDANEGYCFFWLNKQYEKISFIVGPRDNISSHASTWLVVTGDKGKILYEEIVSQTDIPRQVVVDVSGQDRICFRTELRGCDFLGGITFGVVDMWAYTKKDLAQVPQEGLVNPNKEKLAALPSPCPLISKIPSFSYHGKAKPEAVIFDGQSRHITFSMGGEKFNQGLIFTTGSNLLNDNIDCYFMFDLGGEFDYLSFYAGMLTNRHALANDSLRIYADGKLILDTIIRCAWPNQYFEVPINKCRKLTFAKPGNSTLNKDCYICLGDLAVYRGKPVKHHLFKHDRPECPEQADLIDLCGKPYFHYVGRYLSNITDFDFEDCFMDGSTKRRSFHMKDGTEIYKGVMLEANMPPFFEDATLMDVAMIGLLGAGSSISGSDVAAYTGVTAGASPVTLLALPLMNHSGGQASAASFNTYGEYKSCTFTIANKSEYWDAMDQLVNLGERQDKPFRLNVMADHRIVKQIDLTNRMEPQTFTVPLYNSNSLTFWLEPGDTRSGQFVIYDITVSKAPCDIPVPEGYHAEPQMTEPQKSMSDQAGDLLNKALDKVNEAVENVNEILTPTDSVVTSPEGRPGEVVETGGTLPPPVWAE